MYQVLQTLINVIKPSQLQTMVQAIDHVRASIRPVFGFKRDLVLDLENQYKFKHNLGLGDWVFSVSETLERLRSSTCKVERSC